MEQHHSEACIWCSAPENARMNFIAYISTPAPDWENTANENLSHCMECVKIYHRGRAAVVAEKPDMEQVYFLEVPRLRLSLDKCVAEIAKEHDDILDFVNEEDALYSYWRNFGQDACSLPVPVQEILWFPFFLQDEEVNEVFCCVMKYLYRAKQLYVNAVDKPLCGLFMLLIHPNNLISNWARKSVACLSNYVIERCEEFTRVISLMLSVKYLDLFENRELSSICEEIPGSRPILSSHLFPYQELDYWQGLSCFLHWISEENLNHLRSELHSKIICVYSTTLTENNFKTVDECNSFWDKLVGFQQLITKLGFRIWQYLKEAPDGVFNSIFNHPCVRSAVSKMKDTNLERQLGNRLPETSPYAWIRPFVFSLLKYDSIAKYCVTMVLDILTNEMNIELTNQTKINSNQPIANREPSLYMQHSISILVEILENLITCNFLCVSVTCFEKCFKIMMLFLMKFQQNQGSSQQSERCHTSLVRFIRKLLNICVKKEISLTESHLLIQNIDSDTDFRDVDYNLLNMCIQNLVQHLHSIRIEETVGCYNDEGASTSTTSEEYNKDKCTVQDTSLGTDQGESTSTASIEQDKGCTFKPFASIKEEIHDSDSVEPSQDFMQEDSSLIGNFVKVENMISFDSDDNLPVVPRFIKKDIIPCDYVSYDELLLRHGLTRKVSVQVKKLTSDDTEQIRQDLYNIQGTASNAAPGLVQETAPDSVQFSSQDTLPYIVEEIEPGSVQCSSQYTLQNAVPNNLPGAPAISCGSSTDTEQIRQDLYNIQGNASNAAPGLVQETAPDSVQFSSQDTLPYTEQIRQDLYNIQGTASNAAPGLVQETAPDSVQFSSQDTLPYTEQIRQDLYNIQGTASNAAPGLVQETAPDSVQFSSQDTLPYIVEEIEPGSVQCSSQYTLQNAVPNNLPGAPAISCGSSTDTVEEEPHTALDKIRDAGPDTVKDTALSSVQSSSQDTIEDNTPDPAKWSPQDTPHIAESPNIVQDIVPCTVGDIVPLSVSDNVLHKVDSTVDNYSDTSSVDVPDITKDTAQDVLLPQCSPYKYTHYRLQEIKQTNSEKLIQAQKRIKLQKEKLAKICRQDTFPVSSDSEGPEAMLCADIAPDALQDRVPCTLQDTSLNTVVDVASGTSSDNVSGTAQDSASDVPFHPEIHYNFSLERLRGLIKISREKTINQNQRIKVLHEPKAKKRTQDGRLINDQTADNLPYNVKRALPYTAPFSAEKNAPDLLQTTTLDNFPGTSSTPDVPRTVKESTPHIASHKPPIKYSLDKLRDSLEGAKKKKNLQQYIIERQAKRANKRPNKMLTKGQTAVTPDTAKDTPSTSFGVTDVQSPETRIASQHERFSSSAVKQVPSEVLTSCTLTTTVTQAAKLSSPTAVQCSPEGVNQIPSCVNIDLLVAIVLSWKTEWLEKQVYPEQVGDKQKMSMMKVPLSFDSINSYINIFVPLLLRETWHYVLQEYWKIKRIKSDFVDMMYQRHYKISGVKAGCFLICKQKIFSRDMQQTCPSKLDLVILRLNIPGKEAPGYQVFAMVTKAVLQPIPENGRALQVNFMLEIELQVLELDETVLMACSQEDCNVQIQVVTSMMSHLRLFKCFSDLQKHLLVADILCPSIRPVTQIIAGPHPSKLETKLDICQSEAADKIFTCMETELMVPSISLLHGPPGTGKTRTIVNIIERILKKERPVENSPLKPGQTRNNMDTRPRILVCAPSDTAVDLLVLNVAKICLAEKNHDDDSRFNCGLYNIVRLGNNMHKKCLQYQLNTKVDKQMQQGKNREKVDAEKMRKEISDCQKALQRAELNCGNLKINHKASQIELKQAEEERDHLHKQLKDLKKKEDEIRVSVSSKSRQESVLQHADVVFCTLNASGFNHLHLLYTNKQPHFKYVIVDEACQCTEVDTLIPLKFKGLKLLLVGDPHQLQATVVSEKAKELGFQQSMFERMYKYFKTLNLPVNPVHLLRTQYRMHPEICSFPSKYFYNNELETYLPIETIYNSFPFKPYLVFDIIEDGGQTVDKDITNEAESEMVLALVSLLVTFDKLSIGIITPCKQQNILLEDKFKRFGVNIGEKIEVSTVDGFQGQGKDVIILSCVGARGSSIGFVADRNRMNVALTRARKALYIVGHFKTLQMNEDWKELMRDAEKRKLVHSVHIGQYEIAAILCRKIP